MSVQFSGLRGRLRQCFLGSSVIRGPLARLSTQQLDSPDGLRRYQLALPSARPAEASPGLRPLVILLHGFGASGAQLLGQGFPPSPFAQWLEIAEREAWVLAAPDGSGKSWNDGFADASANAKTDDVGFIRCLIDHLIATQAVDPRRVYVMGVSKGGMMSLRLAAELGPKLAGFCAVLASMPRNSRCAMPSHPLPALFIASRSDPLVRYEGGSFRKNRHQAGEMLGIEASVAVWRDLAGLHGLGGQARCTPIAPQAPLDASPKTKASRQDWGGEAKGSMQVSLVTIEGGGHAEPSPTRRYPSWINLLTGAQSADFETAELAWAFFKDKRAGIQT
ncbi:hypothetical protein WG899_10590 [Paucibacter sp. AS339]|uniref:alpha/beta hydrolase family esterase n=1 Tax=Paucibacter hankyongi TaxID=3133434 RepID=UPI00309BA516